ncbi:type IV secretion system protein VirB11 [Candidatus Aerophobetes bacterium]|uniref:Type IV secretion system protein VirB11 n=1 Tax=Aerophobetes bacterium TaxID=2030807 RepID=A0A662D554_UNCAE|nr:MAG: type IV secretion system protein VirB11 [Candidatus Aerophobetes bacterium]
MSGYLSARKILKVLRRGCIALEKKRIEKGEMQAPFPYMVFPATVTTTETQHLKKEPEGIELTHVTTSGLFNLSITQEMEKKDIQSIDITYNLIPRSPKKGEKVFAYAHIHWDKNRGELIYDVVEPPLSQHDKELIEKLKRELEERLDVNFYKIGVIKAKDLLREEVLNILSEEGGLSDEQKEVLLYYIERDIIGLGKIEPLMNDPNIEDISCDGVNIPIYVYHRDTRIGSVKTNVIFEDEEELNTFVIKLAQKCRKTINIAEPLLDAALPDGSRVQATLGTDIARKGSNFTIRKFTEEPLTPIHMLKYGTLDSTQLAYLWLAVENGQSILISGGTATGKTSLLNALSLFIKPSLKVVSIEDTPELRLPHPHWIPEVARTPLSEKERHGEVTLFDLLKSSLRQRPDYIVMGEVRGKEAFVLFQQMATGHPSLATIHAASISQLIDRLTTPPISLPPTLLENINIIVFLVMSRIGEKYVRRANTIIEIVGIEKDRPVTKDVFKWDARRDRFAIVGKSTVLRNIALKLGMDEKKIKQELIRRKLVLEWMLIEGITDYVEFAKIVSRYYSNPQSILNLIKNKYPFLAL